MTRLAARRSATGGNRGAGSKWIRREKRAAIYRRDGHKCVYCAEEHHALSRSLSLDHLTPRSRRGSNAARNLVTACLRCNVERGAATLAQYVGAVRAAEIRRQARRVLRYAEVS